MWIAYQENKSTQINNLTIEKDQNKIWETTIKYKDLKWSITCSKTDFMGHKEGKVNFPHYHFLMEKEGKPFITFEDYHVKLTEEDRIRILAHNQPLGNFIHIWYIPGMEEIFQSNPKEIMKSIKRAKHREESISPIQLTSIIKLDENISSKEINKAFLRYKQTEDTLAKCFSEIPHIKIKTYIEPGEGVPLLDRKLSRNQKKIKNIKKY
jgi:hypothetical protein